MRSLLLLLLTGCGASQLVVHVDTDAPVPPRPGDAPDPMRPPFLFDLVRVEVLRGEEPAAMSGARRDFAVDEGLFADRRVSFGIAPPFGDAGLILRVRLFRGDHALHGEPPVRATLQTDIPLPILSENGGPVDMVVRLHVDNVGQPQQENAVYGTVDKSEVGSWPGARVTPCPAPAGDGEVCIPGGAFWMGDPLLRDIDATLDAAEERLVVVSPFYLDRHEVTVADFRASQLRATTPTGWDPGGDPDVYDAWCTFTRGASQYDPNDTHAQMAANCVTHDLALQYCQRVGKDLPSEAQFEFAASGRGEERSFVWGGDEPTCEDAIWGWGGVGQTKGYDQECRTSTEIVGTRPPGSGRRDRVTIDGVEVVDLAGNLGEWMRDDWSRYSEDFWSRPGVLVDPVGDFHSLLDRGPLKTVRGGAWYDAPLLIRAAARLGVGIDRGTVYYKVGWRCARSTASP